MAMAYRASFRAPYFFSLAVCCFDKDTTRGYPLSGRWLSIRETCTTTTGNTLQCSIVSLNIV